MISEPIFKRDSLGKIRTWQYELNGDSYRTIAGLLDGQKVTSGWTVCTPKSQATAGLQAAFEGMAEQTKKLAREYHGTVDTIDTPNFFKPMLAQTYDNVTFPVYAQPKLDGIRCIATAKGLFSRQGKRFYGVPHIEESLAKVFDNHPDLILDGELYNHDLKDDFNQITSIVRKQTPSQEQIDISAKLIQYHVYDAPSVPETFGKRFDFLVNEVFALGLEPQVQVVHTGLMSDQFVLDIRYQEYIEEGYEGQMVRLDAPYEQKRSRTLLKRKEFQDDEFPIIAIEEGLGNWAGYAKKIVCQLPDGRQFGAGVKGNQDFTRQLLDTRADFIGKKATVRFFAYTPDGVPRFPVAVDFARAE